MPKTTWQYMFGKAHLFGRHAAELDLGAVAARHFHGVPVDQGSDAVLAQLHHHHLRPHLRGFGI